MAQNVQPLWHILVYTPEGRLLGMMPVHKHVLAIASHGDADCLMPELGQSVVFVTRRAQGLSLLLQQPGVADCSLILDAGQTAHAGGWIWTALVGDSQAHVPMPPLTAMVDVSGSAFAGAGFTEGGLLKNHLREWLARPMAGRQDLESALRVFLHTLLDQTSAVHGLIVLVEPAGFKLISALGLSDADVQAVWDKMPSHLTEEIMRSQAKILLPEGLRLKVDGQATVFLKDIRSLAGFPVLAEGRLLGLFYLGFNNLLRELSPELQSALEDASQLLGLVIQRALLREQLVTRALGPQATDVPFQDLKNDSKATSGIRETGNSEAASPVRRARLMMGISKSLQDTYRALSRLAPFDVSVLIQGETGTGKELAARELHACSKRSIGPFVAVNAAALPESLIESELFGHKKGSYTGALSDHAGLVEQAHLGTLFIDEIGELPLTLQSKLLRVLQEKSVLRLGESKPRAVDFRLVCATHRDVKSMVADKSFREDLYYRSAGAVLQLPALRERKEDIAVLSRYFKERFAQTHGLPDKEFSYEALSALEKHTWPGNIRELENVVSRACVMAEGLVIRRQDLGLADAPGGSALAGSEIEQGSGSLVAEGMGSDLMSARDAWMKSYIQDVLKRNSGNRARTAKALGVGERTLFRYLEQLGIKGGA